MSFIPGAVGGGSGLPILKVNAKSGRFTIDGESTTEITFIADLENAEAGWIRFAEGSGPDFRLTPVRDLLAGKPYAAAPDARDTAGKQLYRRGFRLTVRLTPKAAAGREAVRELATNSLAVTQAIDDLLREWEERRVPGKLPRVRCSEWREIKSARGTNFQPVFEIIGVVDRPDDLGPVANGPEPEEFDDDE